MTIRQQGGVFGRNPSFNDVDVVDLTATGDIAADEFIGIKPGDYTSGTAVAEIAGLSNFPGVSS
jgi:hypothetical protein